MQVHVPVSPEPWRVHQYVSNSLNFGDSLLSSQLTNLPLLPSQSAMDEVDVLSKITGGNTNALSSSARGGGGSSRGASTKPRKARVERILKKKEPQLVEAQKKTLILKGVS